MFPPCERVGCARCPPVWRACALEGVVVSACRKFQLAHRQPHECMAGVIQLAEAIHRLGACRLRRILCHRRENARSLHSDYSMKQTVLYVDDGRSQLAFRWRRRPHPGVGRIISRNSPAAPQGGYQYGRAEALGCITDIR